MEKDMSLVESSSNDAELLELPAAISMLAAFSPNFMLLPSLAKF
jgi:hypothetical protein